MRPLSRLTPRGRGALPASAAVPATGERTDALRASWLWGTQMLALGFGLVALVLFVVWEAHNSQGVTYSHWGALGQAAGDDYDEGAYVTSAHLLLRGYHLFSEVFSAQPAFFLPSLAMALRLFPDPEMAGHLYEAVWGLLTLVGVFWMAWSAYRPLAAPLAAGLLALSPGFVLYAHTVEAEMPMLGLCTLALAAAQAYYLRPRRVMAIVSGLLLLGGSEMKLLSAVVALPIVLLLGGGAWAAVRAGRPGRAVVADLALAALAFVGPLSLIFLALAPAEQLRQVVTFHLDASRVASYNAAANVAALGVFLLYDVGLLVAAGVGGLLGLLNARREFLGLLNARLRYLPLVYSLWFLTTLLLLWRYHPLLQHQFVPLLPPLALLGAGIAAIPVPGRTVLRGSLFGARTIPLVVAALAVVVYVGVTAARTLELDGHMFVPTRAPNRALLAALIDARTRPGDFVVCDDPMVALAADRLLPPGLEDPSRVRIDAGYLTSAEAIAATARYHVAAIVLSRPRIIAGRWRGTTLSHSLHGYIAWIGQRYREIPSPVVHAQVYVRR